MTRKPRQSRKMTVRFVDPKTLKPRRPTADRVADGGW